MKRHNKGPIVGAKPPLLERIVRNFDLKSGIFCFVLGLVSFSVLVLFRSLFAEEFHMDGAIIFVIGASTLVGVLGLFKEKVPA